MKTMIFFCLAGSLVVAGCGVNKPNLAVDPQKSAKIRIFRSDNPHFAAIAAGAICFDRSDSQSTSNIVTRLSAPNRQGVPLTDDLPSAWVSSYDEFEIPASQLLVFSGHYAANNLTCGPIGATFFPETGKMYDARITFKDNRCRVRIREIGVTGDGKVETKDVPSIPIISCKVYEKLKKEKILE